MKNGPPDRVCDRVVDGAGNRENGRVDLALLLVPHDFTTNHFGGRASPVSTFSARS